MYWLAVIMRRLNRGEDEKVLKEHWRRSDLISNENHKNSPQSKIIKKEHNQFMKFSIGNEPIFTLIGSYN